MKENPNFFTNEYYSLLSLLSCEKGINNKGSYFTSFREKGRARYECLAIEIVHEKKCQLSCEWCFIADDKAADNKENQPVEFSLVCDIIDQASALDKQSQKLFGQVVFIGGEPTLHPDLDKMVRHTISRGLTPIVVTNGLMLANLKYAKRICLPGVVIVTHLPFFNKTGDKILNKKCGLPGYDGILKRAISNIISIRDEYANMGQGKIEIVGNYVLGKLSLKYALDVHKFCRKNKITPFFERMRIANDFNNKGLIADPEEIKKVLIKIFNYDKKNYPEFILDVKNLSEKDEAIKKAAYLIPPTFNSPCTMTQTGVHIKYSKKGFGDSISCCGQKISHGNVNEITLAQILKNKENCKIFTKQDEYILGPCATCVLYDLVHCEGGCRGNANYTFGCPRASDPQCIFIKKSIRNNKEIMAPSDCDKCPISNQCKKA